MHHCAHTIQKAKKILGKIFVLILALNYKSQIYIRCKYLNARFECNDIVIFITLSFGMQVRYNGLSWPCFQSWLGLKKCKSCTSDKLQTFKTILAFFVNFWLKAIEITEPFRKIETRINDFIEPSSPSSALVW